MYKKIGFLLWENGREKNLTGMYGIIVVSESK